MKKSLLLKIVNLCLVLLFITSAGSAISNVLFRTRWYAIHEYSGYAFSLFALMHIVLNWTWIKSNFFKNKKTASKEQP
jgi:DMSO/TMAO reductase YedYZ heme-binding membrane subunit